MYDNKSLLSLSGLQMQDLPSEKMGLKCCFRWISDHNLEFLSLLGELSSPRKASFRSILPLQKISMFKIEFEAKLLSKIKAFWALKTFSFFKKCIRLFIEMSLKERGPCVNVGPMVAFVENATFLLDFGVQ